MWRFKPSKFKNAIPKTPRNKEEWITDVPIGALSSFGNHIKASASVVSFNVELEGQGNLGVVPLNDFGSKCKKVPILHAHSGFITDFDFCPYDDFILATGSEDCHVKLWRMTEDGKPPSNPEFDTLLPHRIEQVKFHPQADCLISIAENNFIHLWDVNTQSTHSTFDSSSLVQSISWKYSGDVVASCSQDKKLRIWDPRDSSKNQVVDSHYSDKDSRVIWLGDSDQLITTGLGSERQREVFLRDLRNLVEPLATYSGDTSLKAYIPLYDPDTNMLFLVAQADHAVIFCEVLDYAPFLQEATKHISEIQIFGSAMIPKRALHLMDAEVNRLLLLGKNCVLPLSFQIPRKSYRSFHEDLFPETYAPEASLTSTEWIEGKNAQIQKMKLIPNCRSVFKSNHKLGSGSEKTLEKEKLSNVPAEEMILCNQKLEENKIFKEKPQIPEKPRLPPKSADTYKSLKTEMKQNETTVDIKETSKDNINNNPQQNNRRSVYTFGIRQTKFRHLNGQIFPKETHLTDLVSLTKTMPGESDCFAANKERVAVVIGSGGNFLAVLELSKPGRVPVIADMPGILSGVSIMDFCWDPFDCNRLAVACENGFLQIWQIPSNLTEKLEEPDFSVRGHSERITSVKFHPCARDVIATASSDLSICIWDLCSREMKFRLTGCTDQILCIAWSPDGQFIASVSKDRKVRLYNVRESSEAVQEGSGPQGLRGARAAWVLNGTHLAVSGFSKVSERQIYLYDCKDISNAIEDISLDVSPATLIPYYDADSSTLFLSGKGDAIIFAYEVSSDSPHFHPLSHYKCPTPHQAVSFLPKYLCDVRKVEFARAIRLTTTTIEPMSFSVPRTRMEFFQDDLFPPALKTWSPVMTSLEWFSGVNKPLDRQDLRPPDMLPLSEAPPPVKAEKQIEASVGVMFEGEVTLESSLAFLQNSKEKEERLVRAMKSQCELQESDLPQEEFEGVDPSEWDDDV